MVRKALWLWVFFASIPSWVFAMEPEFSADMTLRAAGQVMTGKVYCKRGKVRCEIAQAISIVRMDKKISYTLMPAEKIYMQQPADGVPLAKIGSVEQSELERVAIGLETIGGRRAVKSRVRYADSKGSPVDVYLWLDYLGIPLKVQALDESWGVEYSNIDNSIPPSDDLFEIPADYQLFVMPDVSQMGDFQQQAKGSHQ